MDINSILLTVLFLFEILLRWINKRRKIIEISVFIIDFLIIFKLYFDWFPIDIKELAMQIRKVSPQYAFIPYLIAGAFSLVSTLTIISSRRFFNLYIDGLISILTKLFNILVKNYKTINGTIINIDSNKGLGEPIEITVRSNENNEEKVLTVPRHLMHSIPSSGDLIVDYFEGKNEVWHIERHSA